MNGRSFLIIISFILLSFRAGAQPAASPPRLVVQIVVSQMRYDYLQRFGHNFSERGFRRMAEDGAECTNVRYGYMGGNTPSGLTTLLTGTNPSFHGIVAGRWIDYTTNLPVDAAVDPGYYGLGSVESLGQFAPTQLSVSTLGDELKRYRPASKVMSIALEPVSAVLGGGATSDAAYWFDPNRGNWCTSTYYMDRLPRWVDRFNTDRTVDSYAARNWAPMHLPSTYVYPDRSEIGERADSRGWDLSLDRLFRRRENQDYTKLQITPTGVDLMMDFVRQAIIYENLGRDEYPDLLTVTIDPLRLISETYGTESMETEDALYRLDESIAQLIEFAQVQLGAENVLFMLTSDHGSSDTRRPGSRYPGGLFNVMQFKVVMNGFLNTQYGFADWVTDYIAGSLYLNHRIIFEKGLNLAEIQATAAAFALQFRGVAQAVTAGALQNNHFSGGALQKIQNGFYPKHSGDIVINLMPGWIEEIEGVVSLSGSMYEYDVHVPLLWYGAGIPRGSIHTPVDPIDIAPTLARILGVSRPDAATGHEIQF
jgi:predicted AlkP superfamily pyrophosphatase or phosphodiesterase